MNSQKLFHQLNKAYNKLLDNRGLDPDKYEREDAFMSAFADVQNGATQAEALIDSFYKVHGVYLTTEEVRKVIQDMPEQQEEMEME